MTTSLNITDTPARHPGGWLALAAAPTFVFMAWVVAGAPAICASGPGLLPIDGMASMYLLMSLFHLPPWLKFASRRRAAGAHPSHL